MARLYSVSLSSASSRSRELVIFATGRSKIADKSVQKDSYYEMKRKFGKYKYSFAE